MRDAECVPEYDIGVFDVGAGIFEPFWDASGGGTGGLRDVATGWRGLVVGVCEGLACFDFCGFGEMEETYIG